VFRARGCPAYLTSLLARILAKYQEIDGKGLGGKS